MSSSRHFILSLNDTQPAPPEDGRRNPFASIDKGNALNEKVNEAIQHWRVPGLALAIVDRHTVTSHGYGSSRLGPDAPDVTPATIFDIASMSKSFTAASMALLVQNDEDPALKDISWQTPVSKLDPELQFSDAEKTKEISIEDILSHRTGLQGHEESVLGINHATPDTITSVAHNTRNLPFAYPIRTKYDYNNNLYSCAAHLVSHLTHTPFPTFLRQNFWDKLGMHRTWLGPDNVPATETAHVAVGSTYAPQSKKVLSLPHTPEPEGYGAGSIQSDVRDVARWVHAHIYKQAPLSATSHDELRTPRILQDDPVKGMHGLSPSFYCLGWEVSWYRGQQVVRHAGSWAGFDSNMLYLPELEWGVVMLSNGEDGGLAEEELMFYLIDEVLGVPGEKRFDWRGYWDAKVPGWGHVKTCGEVFPEMEEHAGDEPREDPDLRVFAGRYWSKGYRGIELVFDEEKKQLVYDGSDRSYAFVWAVKERAYGYWYVCEDISPVSGEKSARKCRFEVGSDGQAKRFGVDLYEETGDLIWFVRVEG